MQAGLGEIENVKYQMLDDLDEIEKKIEDARHAADVAEARAATIVPKVKKLDELAREYAGEAEEVMPQPDVLESARSYREKKAKPVFKRFQKVYLALYNAYYDLKRTCENLQRELNRALGRIGTLEATIDRMAKESADRAVVINKHETLCRGIGRDLVEDHVRAKREHEAYEKQQRKQARIQHEICTR